MKKLILFLVAVITTISVYANTCTYDGVQVTLRQESVLWQNGKAMIYITVSDTKVSKIRCQVSCGGTTAWVTFKVSNGNGYADLVEEYFPLSNNQSYTVKLVNGPGQCYN